MKLSSSLFCLTISLLVVGGLPPAFVQPAVALAISSQGVDLKVAVGQFFKNGTLRESWFSPMKPAQFSELRKQALTFRQEILQEYGAYQSVRRQSNECIVTFAQGEMTLVFQLNADGRISNVDVK